MKQRSMTQVDKPARRLRLGIVTLTLVDTDQVDITIPRRLALRALAFIAGCGGVGAVIATAIQGGF